MGQKYSYVVNKTEQNKISVLLTTLVFICVQGDDEKVLHYKLEAKLTKALFATLLVRQTQNISRDADGKFVTMLLILPLGDRQLT